MRKIKNTKNDKKTVICSTCLPKTALSNLYFFITYLCYLKGTKNAKFVPFLYVCGLAYLVYAFLKIYNYNRDTVMNSYIFKTEGW